MWRLNNLLNFMKHVIIKFSELDQQNTAWFLKQWLFFARLSDAGVLDYTFTLQNTKFLFFFLEKYGVIPKKCFPESHTTEATRRMNDILNHKVQHGEQGGVGLLTLKLPTDFPRGSLGASVCSWYTSWLTSISQKQCRHILTWKIIEIRVCVFCFLKIFHFYFCWP